MLWVTCRNTVFSARPPLPASRCWRRSPHWGKSRRPSPRRRRIAIRTTGPRRSMIRSPRRRRACGTIRQCSHTHAPQFQPARIRIEDQKSAILDGFGPTWDRTEEWYSFAASPHGPGTRILATLDESSYGATPDLRMVDHPLIWSAASAKAASSIPRSANGPNLSSLQSDRLQKTGRPLSFASRAFPAGGVSKLPMARGAPCGSAYE